MKTTQFIQCRMLLLTMMLLATARISLADQAQNSIPTNSRDAKPNPSHEFTMRSHRYPETKMYTIMQFGALGALSEPYYGAKEAKLTFDFGAMRNLNKNWALGANFRVESDETDDATGLMLRGRRWLGKDASVDVATGFLKHGTNGPPLENSWVNQAQINIGNIGSVTVEMQTYKLNGMDFDTNGNWGTRTESGTMWLLGGSVHYLPGLAAFIGLGLLTAATWD